MSYNIQFQIAALLMIVMITVLLLEKRAIRIYMQQSYLVLFVSVTCSICFDILSVIAIMKEERIGQSVTHAVCKIYLFTIALVAYALVLYTYMGGHKGRAISNRLRIGSAIPLIAQIAVLAVFPVSIYREGHLVYTYGICVGFTYAVCFLYLACSVFFSVYYFRNMDRHSCYSIWFQISTWILTALIQLLNNELLLVSFAMGISMIYMYIKLENPETYIDHETHVFNSYACEEYMARQLGNGRPFYVAQIRIEGLRYVREEFGEHQEKELLWQLAAFLTDTGSSKTLIFRNGFFTFSIFCESEEKLKEAIDRTEQRFTSGWKVGKMQFKLKYRIAYLMDYKMVSSTKELLDTLQYFIEEAVQENIVIKVDADSISKKKKLLEAERVLQRAVDNHAVQMYYQPIYSVRDKKITALEALVRIQDEDGHIFMPDTFIPLAEKNGLILPLGNCILRAVCEYWNTGEPERLGIEYIEVNLSVVQCMQDTLAHSFLQIMKEMQVPPERINLEITETAALHSEATLLQNMAALLSAGSTFSLDDYGSGYAGLNYLLKLPVKHIKLDRELIWAYFANEKSAVALRHEIAMLHELGFSIIAEGVEDKQQYRTMASLGVEFIQGYYFSKPILPAALKEFMENFAFSA